MRTTLLILVWATVIAAIAAPPSAATPLTDTSTATVRIYVPRGAPGPSCKRVFPLARTVQAPAVLTGAMRALLRGPTAAERRRGYRGWFSGKTAGMLRSVRITSGTAYIDFRNFSRLLPGASSSCGSASLLAQLDRTATQFPTVSRAIYSFNGNRRAFYEWLQLSPPAR
jgi:hypothetical protein